MKYKNSERLKILKIEKKKQKKSILLKIKIVNRTRK